MTTENNNTPADSRASEIAAAAPGSTLLLQRVPWASLDALCAKAAHDWVKEAANKKRRVDMAGFRERFARADFSDVPNGPIGRDQYWLWIFREVAGWFEGFADDSIEARASLAATIASACPFDGSNKQLSSPKVG